MKRLLLLFTFFQAFNLTAQLIEITPDNPTEGDFTGFFIDINDDDLVINASGSNDERGAIFHYGYDGSQWQFNQRLELELTEDENEIDLEDRLL